MIHLTTYIDRTCHARNERLRPKRQSALLSPPGKVAVFGISGRQRSNRKGNKVSAVVKQCGINYRKVKL